MSVLIVDNIKFTNDTLDVCCEKEFKVFKMEEQDI